MPDTDFITNFVEMARLWLNENTERRLILVCGGGNPARIYQNAYRKIVANADNFQADMIGIMATRLNAQLLKASFGSLCENEVVTNPTSDINFTGRVLIAAGWKPGFSSDNDAVLLAQKFNATTVINLSNIAKVYTDDPRKNPQALPLDNIVWSNFIKMIGTSWTPGANTPFDPVASSKARDLGLKVICAKGQDIPNTKAILDEKSFIGTTIY